MTENRVETAERERKVREWFKMWLVKDCGGMEKIFAPDAVYRESWGPIYHGTGEIKRWFEEWNGRAAVLRWDALGFLHDGGRSVAEWRFESADAEGAHVRFDGVSVITWDGEGRIASLTEYGCDADSYNPYADGTGVPRFRVKDNVWF